MANLRADNLTGSGGRNAITGSVFFPENSYLEVTTTSDLALGAGDFTIETWVNFSKIDTYQCIIDFRGSGNGAFPFLVRDTDGDLYYYVNSGVLINNVPARANNCWHHVAVVRSSGTTKIYLNGKEEGSASDSTTYVASNNPTIGVSTAESNDLFGHLSNLRIVKGRALYTANFTPSTEKLTAVAGTVLLCCQDSDDPTQEATGKTITAKGDIPGRTETEYVVNGTFGGSGTSPGGASYSPAWTAWGDTTTAQSGGLFIERTSTLTGVYQQLDQSIPVPGGQYRIRGIISNKTGPGGAIIRLSSAAQGNGTNYFGAYGPGIIDHTFTYSGSGGLFMNLMIGNNTGSADFSNISFRNVVTGDTYNITPPVGVDEGVTFKGDTKVNSQQYMYFPTGDTSQRGRGTALYGGGYQTPNSITAIDYLSIQSGGLTEHWGDLSTVQLASGAACSSSTRWVTAGGWTGVNNNAIEYVEFAKSGKSIEFGDLVEGRRNTAAVANSTRGIWGGGYVSPTEAGTPKMDYITIATTGDAIDFGDLSGNAKSGGVTGSTTRGVFALGNVAPADVNTLEYVTIATLSDYTNFGDLQSSGRGASGCSNGVRGLFAGGHYPTAVNTIDYITIASTGNGTDFGDLFLARSQIGATSNGTRGVFMGGTSHPARLDTIDSVIIATTGNAVNWGDFRTAKTGLNSAASDSHGGL